MTLRPGPTPQALIDEVLAKSAAQRARVGAEDDQVQEMVGDIISMMEAKGATTFEDLL